MDYGSSCILYFYERDKEYLLRLLEVEEKLSETINTKDDAKKAIGKLEEKKIIKKDEININDSNSSYWLSQLRDKIRIYNKCLSKKTRWFLYDENKDDFKEIISDYKKYDNRFKCNLLLKITDFNPPFDKNEIIKIIKKKKAEVKYIVSFCKKCGRYQVIEYRETVTPKCPKCHNKIEFESNSHFFNEKEDAYKKFFEIEKLNSSKQKRSVTFYCYKGINYRFNNNDLISLLKNIFSNYDYNNILTINDKGAVCFKETIKEYLIQCNPEFERIIAEDEAVMTNLNIVQAFYYIMSNDNVKNLRIISKPTLFFRIKNTNYSFKEIKDFIDLLYNQKDEEICNELINVFTSDFYYNNFFSKVSDIKGHNLIDLSYLIYKYENDFCNFLSNFQTNGYTIIKYGPNFLKELYKYQEQDEINNCLNFLWDINEYELFNFKFSEYPTGQYLDLCIIQQQINNNHTFNYKGIIFSTNIEQATKDLCELIKKLYLEGSNNSNEYLILKELLSKNTILCKLFNYSTSDILLKLSENIQQPDITLLDLYLSSYSNLSIKNSIFLIKGIRGTIVEIARNAIENNWLNNFLVDLDLKKIKEDLLSKEDLLEINGKASQSFAEIEKYTK